MRMSMPAPPPAPEMPKPPPAPTFASSTIPRSGAGSTSGKKPAGFDPTIATSGQGDLKPASTTSKTLIGQ